MHPQRSLVIQGSFPAGRPRVAPPVARPGQPGRPVVQPAGPSYVTQLDPTRLNLGGAGGSALPEPVQRKMETFFKTDFSDVRVFMGPQAPSIGALAFTLGSNIYFAPGQYNPQSVHGQQLLGHELAHVLQQRAGRVRNPQGSGVAVVQDPHLEAEADRLGRQAAAQPMMPMGGLGTQRPGLVQATPAASLPGTRPLAPHVQAAIAACAQPKMPVTQPGGRPLAPHVQAAVATCAQPKSPAAQPGGRPLAPHVQAAVTAVGQPKLPTVQPGGQPLAPHVQAAVTAVGQPKMPMAQPEQKTGTGWNRWPAANGNAEGVPVAVPYSKTRAKRVLPPPSTIAPTPAILQCYTVVTNGDFRGKRSDNGNYVTGEGLSEVYAKRGFGVERSHKTNEEVTILGEDYDVWEPDFPVIGDCVACMEEIMHGKQLKYGAPGLTAFRDSTSDTRPFGESDDLNRKHGTDTNTGAAANPAVLEGIVIVRQATDSEEELPQFHGAAVVARDGEDYITLETSAPESGPISRDRVYPVYDMYSGAQKKRERQSFKAAHKRMYGKDATVSVVKPILPLRDDAVAPPSKKSKKSKVVNFQEFV